MISVHSNQGWIDAFVPKLSRIKEVDQLTDTSTGTIAALNSYQADISHDEINSLCDRYQQVIIYMCEPFLVMPRMSQFPKVTFFSDVVVEQPVANHRYVGNWFMGHDNFYATACWSSSLLAQLNPDIEHKPYCFDALLGVQRPHRDLIYAAWQDSINKKQILLTYHGNDSRRGVWHVPYQADQPAIQSDTPDPSFLQVTLWTDMPVPDGQLLHRINTAHLVPVKIYNDSWYSIIAEGFFDQQGTRLTEKTAKAFVAERLFVYFGGQHDLARMRRLGFQTFDNVIDESYDEIEDNQTRWQTAWQQVEWLCDQDPMAILSKTRSQRKHNRHVFLSTDWHANLKNHLFELCAQC